MDFGRKPYRTACRFLRDSDIVSTVRWYEAAPDAPTLGKTCVIYRREWDNDEGILDAPVGEVSGAAKKFLAGFVPPGLPGEHVCGTDEEFDTGGTFSTVLPPVLYDSLGWPLCCGGARRVKGGAGGAGRATVVIVHPLPPSGCCLPPIALGVWYEVTIPTLPGGVDYHYTTQVGHTYRLEVETTSYVIWQNTNVSDDPFGGGCLDQRLIPDLGVVRPCYSWVARGTWTCVAWIPSGAPATVRWRLVEGPCP